ncbi:DUF4920 domain-containing protein [Joostella atrarenae]|uniref:DUF4920 domain-containing protein n=1 Tax=Joostella atrarenae TaxID=679257 RepID=A0ABS9J3T4_9FLAO|nr:DUF4920 domain-containing protein [Joostella atrarenae]MCF8715091.1 DUF4920 domain-containing protein [Joostella atrarenae]
MKIKLIVIVLAGLLASCTGNKRDNNKEIAENYNVYGDTIMLNNSIDTEQLLSKYHSIEVGDSTTVVVKAEVVEVCQKKGCWMKLDLPDGELAMVKFKDYGFFVPKDIAGKEVILKGNAFVDEVSVSDLKHYAQDAGKTEEEIAAITAPERTFAFEANGVLLKK